MSARLLLQLRGGIRIAKEIILQIICAATALRFLVLSIILLYVEFIIPVYDEYQISWYDDMRNRSLPFPRLFF